MQGIDKIIDKIISDAKADAKQTAQQTKKQVSEVRAKHEEQTKKQIAELEAEFAERQSQLKDRAQTMADLEARRNTLSIKRELVEESFSAAKDMLLNLSDKEYLGYIEKLMKNLGETRGDVIVGRDEKRITEAFIESVNKKTDKSYKLSSQKGAFSGGFVLKTGRIETNCTLDMLVTQAKRGMEQEVALKLFDESGD